MKKDIDGLTLYFNSLKERYIIHTGEYDFYGYGMYIMEHDGNAFVRLYMDKDVLYIDMLSVSLSHRSKKIASDLLCIAEQVAKFLLCENILLWCNKYEWVFNWYKRLGYEFYLNHYEDNCVWMKKQLIRY